MKSKQSLRLGALAGAAALVSIVINARAAASWADLFNGTDLTGWVQRGGAARYAVENGVIVGASVTNTDNSFLCTTREYGDFVLEYDFKVDARLNSGVQIRSECLDHPAEFLWRGKTIRIPAGRVHGYQVEIDPDVPRQRMWSAGIYDEARRGWLFPDDDEKTGPRSQAFSAKGRRIFKPEDWNHVRVEAIGDSIVTWLNGTECARIRDFVTPRGLIALQVHGIGNDSSKQGAEVRWRNLRIQEIPPNTLSARESEMGWRLLWDGRTTAGWRGAKQPSFPEKGWEIRDGLLTVLEGGGGESVGGGDIITTERFSNFELAAEFRISPGANSGIKSFVQPNLDPITGTGARAEAGSAIGLEFQVLDDERHPDAKAGRDGNRTMASLYDLKPATSLKHANAIGEWNFARVVSRGSHVEHWLNGLKVLEYERGSAEFTVLVVLSKYKSIPGFGQWTDGHILLQDHGNRVSYRNLKLRILPVD